MSLNALILAGLVAEVLFLSRLDRKRFGTWITPFSVLAYPYLIVALLVFFLAGPLDFVPLYSGSVLVWSVGLLIVWSAGAFLGWGMLDLRAGTNWLLDGIRGRCETSVDLQKLRSLALTLACFCIPAMFYGVVTAAGSAGGWTGIGTAEYREAYSHGWHGHAVVLGTLVAIVLIGTHRRGDRRSLLAITALVVFIVLSLVKGTILQVMIGGLFVRIMRHQFHPNLKKLAILSAAVYAMFNLVYLISMSVVSSGQTLSMDVYAFLARHFLYYLFAGVLGYSEALRTRVSDVGGDWSTIFAPFINLYHAAFGGSLVTAGSLHEKGMSTDLVSTIASESNVYTFFGTLHLYLGPAGMCLYVFLVAILSYGFLVIARRSNSLWLMSGYCFVAAQLALGCFEFYFWYLTTFEIIVFSIILAAVGRRRVLPSQISYPVIG